MTSAADERPDSRGPTHGEAREEPPQPTASEPPSGVITPLPAGIGADDATIDDTAGPGPASRPSVSGRYRPKVDLATGGMGKVELVHDTRLRRDVARKTLKPGIGGPAVEERFVEEARLTAQLAHPNIMPIYDLEHESTGGWAFTMKHVDGVSLADVVERLRKGVETLPERSLMRRMQVFMQICQAVAFAHDHGVIHRDLKPSNVMIGAHGEVIVLDWGIARTTEPLVAGAIRPVEMAPRQFGDTLEGALVGTPRYMSPEQARGESDVDQRIDVWALGAILFELITLRTAFEAGALPALLQKINDEPVAVPAHDFTGERLPVGLVEIVHKALAKDREERYADVPFLMQDLMACLEDRPTVARPERLTDVLGRLMRQRMGASLAALTAVFGVVMVLVGLLTARLGAQDEQSRLRADLLRAATVQLELGKEAIGHARQDPIGRPPLRARAERCWGKVEVIASRLLEWNYADRQAMNLMRELLEQRLAEAEARGPGEQNDDIDDLRDRLQSVREALRNP